MEFGVPDVLLAVQLIISEPLGVVPSDAAFTRILPAAAAVPAPVMVPPTVSNYPGFTVKEAPSAIDRLLHTAVGMFTTG